MKKLYLLFSTLLILIFSNVCVYAADSGYIIEKYDVYIDVAENNILTIEETINVNFETSKHGIIRKIPLKNTVERTDGTSEKNTAKIENISVENDEYEVTMESGYASIKIGSAASYVKGEKEYKIKYDYMLSRDKARNYDELYYNIIGPEWDTKIENVSFTINMPKEFDATKVGFSSGKKGTIGTNNINFKVDGTTIWGSYNKSLAPEEAFTIRLELEDGYFEFDFFQMYADTITKILGIVVLVIIAYLVWNKYGKDMTTIETVEFYPPENFNSAEIGYLYKGKAGYKEVVSMIVYMANKGYIKILDYKEKSLFSSLNSFVLEKVKEYDGDNANERAFMNELFGTRDTVSKEYLELKMYYIARDFLKTINTPENKSKIFEKTRWLKNAIIILCMILVFALSVLSSVASINGIENALIMCAVSLFYIPFLSVFLVGKVFDNLFAKIFILFHMSVMLGGFGLWTCFTTSETIVLTLIGICALVLMGIMLVNMPKRTVYGVHILGKIEGFKNFLEVARKEEVERLLYENPSYVYDVLPYIYVLDISDEYMKKFENFITEPPSWYSGRDTFNTLHFSHFMSDMLSTTERAAMPKSSGSSGGGSSGGGFSSGGGGSSGGGSGGGGGSSW